MALIISIIGIILTIFFVVGFHEAAHFLAARCLNVKVLRFSIGFGKPFYRWHDKKGTEYVLAPIPLGGYVKMVDENEEKVAAEDLPYAFNRQPLYKKWLIILAGPFANILCAFILYWLIFQIGFTTLLPLIGKVTPHSIAAEAGIQPEQLLVQVDHKQTHNWTSVILRLLTHAGNQDTLHVVTENFKDHRQQTHVLNLRHWQMDNLTPDPLASLGLTPYEPPIPLTIAIIEKDSPAAHSPLAIDDKIVAIDHKPVKDWLMIHDMIQNHPDQSLNFTVLRAKKLLTFPVTVGYQRSTWFKKQGYLGIAPDIKWPPSLIHQVQAGPLQAISMAYDELRDFTYLNLLLLGKILTGKLSVESLGGPITIFSTAGSALNYGLISFLSFLAFLSISIGVINLLPIPGLDGGHIFIQCIEFIIRRPLPERVLLLLYRIGFTLLFLVLLQSLINDILRW